MTTQILTIANTTVSGWSPQGQSAGARSGDNAIDQDDSTSLAPTSTGAWNAVYVLPSSFAVDSYRVLSSGGLTWRLQTGQGTSGADSEFTTQAQGGPGDTGVVSLPVATPVREVRLNVTISNTADRIFSFEVYAGGEPVPVTLGEVDAQLAAWLRDDGDNTHQDTSTLPGLPWTTKAAVDVANGTLDAVSAAVDAAQSSIDTTNAVLGALPDPLRTVGLTVTNVEDFLLDHIGGWADDVQSRLTGGGAGGGSAFSALQGSIEGITVDVSLALTALREQLTLSPDLADATRWSLVTTVSGTGDGLVEAQADLYLLTLSAPDGGVNHQVVAGTDWFPRWGWVAPRVHGAYRERQFPDLSPCVINVPSIYMDGLLVYAHPGVAWQVDAYVLDRP